MRALLLFLLVVITPLIPVCQLLNNYDTCRTQVYYQSIGSDTKETHIEKARTVQDNGIISAGYLKQAGSQDAVIIKQDKNGQVIWEKEYGNASYDEQFTDWRELPNRQLLLSGIAKNRATLQSIFFMMLLSADGNIIWQKSYTDIAASSNITNAKIYPYWSEEYFFAIETDASIIYGMTNNIGIVNWQRSITTNTGTKLVAAVSYSGNLLIATNSMDSGYHTSNLYYINYYWTGHPKEIKFSTKLGGAHQNSNYTIHDYEQYSQYTYFSGIRSVNNAPYEVIRVNMNQGFIHEALETIVTPGVAIDSLSRSAINIYGDMVSFTSGRKNDRLNTIQLTGSENIPTYVTKSSSYNLPDSIVLKGNIKTWDNGYVFYGAKELPGGNQKIIQLKADSASLGPGCINSQHENFNIVRTMFPSDTMQYTYNVLHGLTGFGYTAVEGNGIIDTSSLCKELKCPPLPLTDSCFDSYQKLYRSYEPESYSTSMQIVNSRTFVSGSVRPMDYIPEQSSSFIAEINKNGQVLNQKKFVIGIGSYTRMFKAKDSSLLLYGFTSDSSYYPSVCLAKIDTNLNVTWIKSLRLTTTPQYGSNQSVNGDVKQGSDGSYFIQYSDGITFGATTLFLTKLDVNGNYLWSKVYRASYPGIANLIMGRTLEVSGGNVYIMCRNAYNAYAASILLKVTENNGNLLWCKKYSTANEYLDLSGMMSIYNNELLFGGTFSDNVNVNRQNIIIKAGIDGNILSAVTLKNPTTNNSPFMQFMHNGNGNIYMNGIFYATPPYSNPYQINVTVNNNLDIITSKKRPSLFYNSSSGMAIGSGGQLYETGSYTSGYNWNSLLYLIKFSPDGKVGTCPSDSMLLEKINGPSISVTDITCVQSDSFFTIRTPVYRSDQFFLATSKLVCASVPGCNSLDVTGSDSICDKSLTYTFHAIRNSGCLAPLQWIYDNSNVQILNETDSSITLRFLATGNFLLKARFTSNCVPYTDSLLVHVMSNAPVLNLGVDTTLCPGAQLLLNAKKGFRSYLWQDGSTDSIFTVTTAGLYYVTATDSCNNLFTDSIQVLINANGPVLNLGPDSNFCSTNTIQLNAHAGFLSYQWQDGSTDSILIVTTPGLYFVTVTDICGNSISDTVKIKSYRMATSLNLGVDTTLCNQGPVQLNAGSGFKNYLWQDGSIDSIFITQNPGLYYVQVTDSCGAIFTDSIRLLVDNVIVFDIGPDTAICKADSLLLKVTTGLSNYLWWPQVNITTTGPAATVFPSTSTIYHVSALKPNGCQVTDSILVNVNIPQQFNLGPDSNICAGDSMQLNAGIGFNNYTWSTGEHTASIMVYQAGQYFVSATDNNKCVARDNLSILQIIPLPVTQLPREKAICLGQPTTLFAGAGFKSYLWNTGALTESIILSAMGQYWVTVTNSFGCRQTDSVNINRELPTPINFITAKDSTICNFETMTITPSQNYATYLWSNGSNTKSITVNNAGNYWLKVTDINGCIGNDSFRLATKECNIGVFFPTGFTPNNDGWNDTYKPKAYGRINSYRFIIYNRYGQKLFDSNNITEGWNGEFKGVKQETGGFVYQCWYQLIGEDKQYNSGSFLLIR